VCFRSLDLLCVCWIYVCSMRVVCVCVWFSVCEMCLCGVRCVCLCVVNDCVSFVFLMFVWYVFLCV